MLGSLGGFFFLFLRNFCKSSSELVEIAYQAAKERASGESQYSTASVTIFENRVLAIETAQSRLTDSYAAEITPETIYTPKMKAWANELVALKAEIKKLKGKSNEGGVQLWNLSLGDQKIQSLQFKPLYAAIAKEPKPDDFNKMLTGVSVY